MIVLSSTVETLIRKSLEHRHLFQDMLVPGHKVWTLTVDDNVLGVTVEAELNSSSSQEMVLVTSI